MKIASNSPFSLQMVRWFAAGFGAALFAVLLSAAGQPIRPLAQEHVVVGESAEPATVPLYTPSILRLDGGRLIATYERGGEGRKTGAWAVILTSDDGGLTWQERTRTAMVHGRLFAAGAAIYYLGHKGDLRVCRSLDRGETWSEPAELTTDQAWHQTAANVWKTSEHVYLVMERRTSRAIDAWYVGELAPVLMRARLNDDLTQRASWTFASELTFADLIPGYRENAPATEFFGLPFHPQSYPGRTQLGNRRNFSPMGWLETNVVQLTDPDHVWHDPAGKTFHLFMRANTGTTGYAALAQVVENADGTMTTSLVKNPSGRTALFLPFPGGQMRFHVLYDERTKLYWLLGTQATDSMRRVDRLPAERYGAADNERQRLVLHFSKNMVDWCFAGIVATGGSPREARHYASMDFDGEDLVILSRSGNARAKSAHDGNLITFHRVKNFRDLVY